MSLLNLDYLNVNRCIEPWPHWTIKDVLQESICRNIIDNLPCASCKDWVHYNNDLEYNKKTLNKFEHLIHKTLKSDMETAVSFFNVLINCREKLIPDFGLYGAGIHVVCPGGYLQTHVDYAIHPVTKDERRLNCIIFLNTVKTGALQFFAEDGTIHCINPQAGSMVIWEPTECPGEMLRLHGTEVLDVNSEPRYSYATYFLAKPRENCPRRFRALFVPKRGL